MLAVRLFQLFFFLQMNFQCSEPKLRKYSHIEESSEGIIKEKEEYFKNCNNIIKEIGLFKNHNNLFDDLPVEYKAFIHQFLTSLCICEECFFVFPYGFKLERITFNSGFFNLVSSFFDEGNKLFTEIRYWYFDQYEIRENYVNMVSCYHDFKNINLKFTDEFNEIMEKLFNSMTVMSSIEVSYDDLYTFKSLLKSNVNDEYIAKYRLFIKSFKKFKKDFESFYFQWSELPDKYKFALIIKKE
ncbi:hypothetical protein H312_03355 [Anncaliia algerae PRA339]|uniref:Uncharacterized protein n=1 Tax=Anncaliia algerae PRA339 TaxID=1288291 RepID=A0A059EWE9_9MICR|nr:hypothetical protein H312_03355 [Anncaliia algerae PRA339]